MGKMFDENGHADPNDLREFAATGIGGVVHKPTERVVEGKKVTTIIHEGEPGTGKYGGELAGMNIEHDSGRVDGHAFARPAAAFGSGQE